MCFVFHQKFRFSCVVFHQKYETQWKVIVVDSGAGWQQCYVCSHIFNVSTHFSLYRLSTGLLMY